ncbi:MAG: aryl-sulfate sulfotransferase [Spirochaetales bacterium]|nr:aryl-sulfate sulfotransferase [Spirochaetales bacterium]
MGLLLQTDGAYEGYTLFAPRYSTTTYLIDIKGNIVHSWKGSHIPGLGVYLLENGHLLRTANVNNSKFMNAGGGGGGVQLIDWDGIVLWDYLYSSSDYCQHHDVKMLPNGNVLIIAWEKKTPEEAVAAGSSRSEELWPDQIIEVRPDGASGGTIVWEWHLWDHLIQDYDSSKANYGVVSEHPELLDINHTPIADMSHINSIDYNPAYDQLLLSVRHYSEIWIIDHSTTTKEAAGHTGGKSGKGGDLLYRWGNPRAYGAGTESDRKFFTQHDAQWIPPGLPGAGHVLVFNNGENRPGGIYSTVEEIVLPVDEQGKYRTPNPGTPFGPSSPAWIYRAEKPENFYSLYMSGVQRLPNGNTLICEGDPGIFLEITSSSEIVWKYSNKINNPESVTLENPVPLGNDVFKIRRYGPEYPAFAGRDLRPGKTVE